MATIDVGDITFSVDESGDLRANVGDLHSGTGWGAGVAIWGCTDGFISQPNEPTASGCAQAIYWRRGNTTRVLAIRDNRYVSRAGQLAAGDRAIVSNCAANLLLDQSANTIALASTDVSVVVDGAGGAVTVKKGNNTVTVNAGGISLAVGSSASLTLGAASIVMVVGATTFTIDAAGASLTSTPPAVLTVNGVTVTVP